MDLHPVNLSGIGEEQDIIMGGGDEEILHKIFLFDVDAHLPLSAAMLAAVEADRISLDISRMGDGHDHILFGDEVFDSDFWGGLHDFRFPFIPEGIADGEEFLLDQIENQPITGKEGLQAIDQLDSLLVLLDDFTLFEVGQPLEPHLQDRLGLLHPRKANFSIKRSFASLGVLEALIVAMTASIWSIAFFRPSRI